MGAKEFAASKSDGMHRKLAALIGEWQGTTRVWFEPDKLAEEAPIRGTIKSILDGRFALHEYASTFMGKQQLGLAIYGYHLDRERFETAWVDSGHNGTAIMFSTSERGAAEHSVLGSYGDGNGGPDWGWRTVIEPIANDRLLITAYNVTPDGQESKAVEIDYRRGP
jgi:Protein of unknown function (DUF1579)